jgi:TetR/AcrR family transcriptional regulator, mexJK operon transcriptional repressor
MPRTRGQIDARKHQAILDAAAEVLAERGFSAPIEEVARRAGVAKQTIYNHYGSKTELVRTLVDRRRSLLTAAIASAPPGQPVEETLAGYAVVIVETVSSEASLQLVRTAIAGALTLPELAHAVYDAGARAATLELAEFLRGRPELEIDDAERCADVFMGMAMGRLQTRLLLGADPPPPEAVGARAREAALRFVRAYRRTDAPPPSAASTQPLAEGVQLFQAGIADAEFSNAAAVPDLHRSAQDI